MIVLNLLWTSEIVVLAGDQWNCCTWRELHDHVVIVVMNEMLVPALASCASCIACVKLRTNLSVVQFSTCRSHAMFKLIEIFTMDCESEIDDAPSKHLRQQTVSLAKLDRISGFKRQGIVCTSQDTNLPDLRSGPVLHQRKTIHMHCNLCWIDISCGH